MELHENHHVLGHCAQRPDQPREIGEDIVFLSGMAEDLYLLDGILHYGLIDLPRRRRSGCP